MVVTKYFSIIGVVISLAAVVMQMRFDKHNAPRIQVTSKLSGDSLPPAACLNSCAGLYRRSQLSIYALAQSSNLTVKHSR